MIQSRRFLGRLLGPLLKTDLLLMKDVLALLAINVLIPLVLTARSTAEILGLGTTILIISNKEMEDTMKIVKSLKEHELLIKSLSKTLENEAKE